MLASGFGERLVRALHDALAADVDPRARGHLAEHHEALAVELVEVVPGRPARHEVGVRDEHARRVGMRLEDADGLARLDEQRLVLVQRAQRRDDRVEALPVARRAPDTAVDHQLLRILGHVRVEIVHEHAQRRFGEPAFRRALAAPRRADHAVGVARSGGSIAVVADHAHLVVAIRNGVRPHYKAWHHFTSFGGKTLSNKTLNGVRPHYKAWHLFHSRTSAK